jgi:ankyrin repeat protein
VAVLLRRGANPQLRDHAGHTALDRAREAQNSDVVKLLQSAKGTDSAPPHQRGTAKS